MDNHIQHLGVIMDGNRRWAKNNKLETMQGHNKGAENFGHICDWCLQDNIPYLTVYAFSTENWKRDEREVRHLFGLMEKYFIEEQQRCIEKDVQIRIIGERSRFDKRALGIIEDIEAATKDCKKLMVQIALSYGGRDEIVRAAKKIASDVQAGQLDIAAIDENLFASYLDTAGVPDVDLIIRTGGSENRRLSNFLPWQSVYSELFFSDLFWPEMTQNEYKAALDYYAAVQRKLGK